MTWLYFAFLFSIAHAGHSILIKLAGDSITPVFAMVVSNTVVFIGSLIIFFIFKSQGTEIQYTNQSLIYMAFGGVAVIVFELALFYMFHMGAPLTMAYAITRILPLIAVVFIGSLFFQEGLNLQRLCGIILGALGIYLMVKK